MSKLEIAANVFTALSIWLAGRNSIHNWWLGIIGCSLFALLFYRTQFYADFTLQGFFIVASLIGWVQWQHRESQPDLPITHARPLLLMAVMLIGLLVAAIYGMILHRFTNAYAPFWDSIVLVGSVIAQVLMIRRKVESWGLWLLVNSIAVPLFASRGLSLTSALYAAFWCNALYAWWHWRKQAMVTMKSEAVS